MIPRSRHGAEHARSRVRHWIVVLAVCVAAGALAVLASGLQYHSRAAATAATAVLTAAGARDVAVASATLTPLRGVTFDSISLSVGSPRHPQRLAIRSVTIAWRPLALILHARSARRTLALLSTARAGTSALDSLIASPWFRPVVRHCTVSGLRSADTGSDSSALTVTGMQVRLLPRLASLDVTSGADTVDSRVNLPLTLVSARGSYSAGVLEIEKASARILGGTLEARATWDIRDQRLDTVDVTLGGASLSEWYRIAGGTQGRLLGTLALSLHGSSGAQDPRAIAIAGDIRLDSVRAESLAVQTTLGKILNTRGLGQVSIDSLTARYVISPDRVLTPAIAAKGLPLSFVSSGWITLGGAIEQRLQGTIDATLMNTLEPVARHTFIPLPGGAGRFACTVKGTFAHPVVSLDQRMVQRAVEGMFDQILVEF